MRVAIIGSGISGLTTLWALKKYSDHEVNVYESADRVGGQAVGVEPGAMGKDSHFQQSPIIAHGLASEHLVQLLEALDIPRSDANLDMSVTVDGVVKKKSLVNLVNPRAWRYALDVLRFKSTATDLLENAEDQTSLCAYLKAEGYSQALFDHYILPLVTLLFLVPDDLTALEMPAATIIKRLQDEGFLNNTAKWFTIQGGAQRLAESLANVLPTENLHLNAEIVSVSSEEHGVRLVEANGHHHIYDHVIMATPAEQTRSLLERGGWVSDEESKFLSAYKWQSINTGSTEANGSASPSTTTKIQYTSSPAPPAYDESQPGITQHISLSITHNAQNLTLNPPTPTARWTLPFPTPETTTSLSLLPHIQNRRISYIPPSSSMNDAIASATAITSAQPFNATPPQPTAQRKTHGAGLALRLVATNGEKVRRILSPMWPLIALPVVVCLAVAGGMARPLASPLPGLVGAIGRLREAWALY